jgi:hypothetical protein
VGLKGNLKTERIAASMGISHDKYLEQLVGRGTTQEELNAGTAAAGQNPNRPKSRIYG